MNKNLFYIGMKILVIVGLLLGLTGTTSTLAQRDARIAPELPQEVDALPVADSQSVSTIEEIGVAIHLTASDEDNDPLTYTIVTLPANGGLTGNTPNVNYTPNLNFFGIDSFTFKVNDGTSDSNIATVSITVTNVNDNPVAVADAYETPLNTPLVVVSTDGVLANDLDPDDQTLTAILGDGVDHGQLTFKDDGTFVYKPTNNYSGLDSFTYRVFDGFVLSEPATVTISVAVGNTPPEAEADSYVMYSNMALTVVAATGLLANDTDIDGDLLTAQLVGGVAFGDLTFNADGSFVYVPNVDYVGDDHFAYMASDGNDLSIAAMVTITVNYNPNHEPVAVEDRYGMRSGTMLTVYPSDGVLDNDSDPDGDVLVAQLIENPERGSLTFNSDGSFEYTPAAGYFGQDQFTYQAVDWLESSNQVEVTILVMVDPAYQLFMPMIIR